MKRKAIFALAVAVAMLVAVIPVSAGSSYDYGTYGGSYYEISATCNDVYVRTSCESRSYTAKVSGDIYRYSDSSIPYTTIGPESNKSSIYLDTTFKFDPLYIVSHHYINNINILPDMEKYGNFLLTQNGLKLTFLPGCMKL